MSLSQATAVSAGSAQPLRTASSAPVRIMVDVDATLTTLELALSRLNANYHTRFNRFNISCYDITSLVGMSPEEGWRWWEEYGKDLFGVERQQPGANRVLQRLAARGVEPWIVTARPHWARAVTETWLRRRRIPYAGIIMHARDKLKICQELHVAAAIEDSPANALRLAEVMPVVLIRWGYNQDVRHPRIFPVTTWSEVESVLLEQIGALAAKEALS